MSEEHTDVAAIVVDFHAGAALGDCVDSLRSNGVANVVVVENGAPGSALAALGERVVKVVEPGMNLGYGRGVNRGVAHAGPCTYLLISNPDVVVHSEAVSTLANFLDSHPAAAVAGPQIQRPDGSIYPSFRVFPNFWLAALHALLAPLWPGNPATRRYCSARRDGSVDWVSGACFLIRRHVFEEIGGFDERYFMFAEEMALCWQVREHGYSVAGVSDAVVTHIEGVSRRGSTKSMVLAHHASALRFEWQTARGLRRVLAPLATLVLALRLVVVLALRRES